MSREIKFRAWDGKMMLNKTMFDRNWYSEDDRVVCGLMPNQKRYFKVMQYTGLKDKNGKEIYEGDIVLYQDEPFKYEWNCNGHWMCKRIDDNFSRVIDYWQAEVIGNIYENPELLEGEA